MKKLTALILSAVLFISVFSVFPVSAAESFFKKDGFVYELEGEEARICFYFGDSDEVVYPSQIDGHKVTKIGVSEDEVSEEVILFEEQEKEYFTKMYSCSPNKNIKEVTIPDTVTYMGAYCFRYYEKLEKITLSNSLTKIANEAFYHCGSLKSVVIPSGVKNIDNDAFADCKELSEVKLPDTLERIGYGAFGNTALKSLNIPENVKTISFEPSDNFIDGNDSSKYIHAFDSAPIETITVSGKNKTYSSKNGVLYNKKKTVLYYYPLAKSAKKFTVIKTVKKISPNAFYGNSKLSKVTFKTNKIKEIIALFNGCTALKSVQLPESVKKIQGFSFCGCKKLTSFTVGKNVSFIGQDAFSGCSSLSKVKFASKKNLTIEYAAFSNCKKLKRVTVPKNVKKISSRAFGYTYTLNKNDNRVYSKLKGFTIKGAKNSAAYKYAKKNKFKFVAI